MKLTEDVCENLAAWGYTAWKIVGSTKKDERREILQKFKRTPNSFLVNCMVATKGFDEPSIERAVLYYATDSKAKYYQTVGRACRSHEGKSGADVFDYGGNLSRFWHPDSRVDWVGMFEDPEIPGEGLAPTKE